MYSTSVLTCEGAKALKLTAPRRNPLLNLQPRFAIAAPWEGGQDTRLGPSPILRGSKQWKELYKRRTIIECEISSMKSHPALERPNTYNTASIRADVFLNACVKLITVVLAFVLDKPFYMRNIKNLLLSA
ncbi:MAG: hypothetical protein FWB88_10095 [Defluviitaleaceae bacterium]|nr:hypothetical protein [Defluviitaleaceae bacterium]MCL2239874.1 hypothetical protein [Defluviitaleaceae bacterium]